jgi:putative component of membrane protein insertase Oxa1/YidC/SpoIIIJ protein YidD
MIILLSISLSATSQNKDDINRLKKVFHQPNEQTNYSNYISFKNEFQEISSLLFFSYKQFFSSQDVNSCAFSPSCSVFAVEAIQKKGIFMGVLMATDRLLRCNKLSPELYTEDLKTGLFLDPVK